MKIQREILATALAGLWLYAVPAVSTSPLKVDTTVGKLYGMVNGSTPDVAQFLGVPFAEPPTGSLRFQPPQRKQPVPGVIDATKTGPNCPQYPLTTLTAPSVYTIDSPYLQPYGPWSEDCLTLNVWTPLQAQRSSNVSDSEGLPVLVWIFGGGFYEGGLLTNGMDPSQWIQRTGSHIVVGINYRNNIFGFPNSRGLAEAGQNLNFGLQDQRLAVEWVRDNIQAFGGDPSRIVIWGQSSGAASCDFYNYAYPEDPIISGLIMHSGNAFATGTTTDLTHTNFTFVAQSLGCGGNLTAKAELECMQKVDAEDIISFYENWTLNHTGAETIKFTTVVDNVTKFDDYTERAYAGNYSKVPAIFGTNANEEASLIAWAGYQGPGASAIHSKTLSTDQCPANYNGELRYNTSALTFRYFNTANFSNISPRPWEGAYHTSELPLIFGTYSIYTSGNETTRSPTQEAFEAAVSSHWQDLYLAFIRDPVKGLPAMGWPAFQPEGGNKTVLMFGGNGTEAVVSQLISNEYLTAPCVGVAETYN